MFFYRKKKLLDSYCFETLVIIYISVFLDFKIIYKIILKLISLNSFIFQSKENNVEL